MKMPKGKKNASSDGTGFPAKYAKVLGEDWMNEADGLETDELKKIIVDAANLIEEQENMRDSDMDLKQLKDQLKEKSGIYKEDIFYQKARTKYSLKVLESRGIKTTPVKAAPQTPPKA